MELWKHQQQAIREAHTKRDYALFFEQGTGKTRTAIEILRRKFAENERVLRTIIFCPKIVTRNWKDEILKFSKIKPSSVVILTGTQKKRIETFQKNSDLDKIFITNYESVEMKTLFGLMQDYNFEILIADESQRLKNYKAVRSKKVAELSKATRHNYILTGTPVLNNSMDLFQQFLVLDRGETFGSNFFSFRAKYFEDKNERWKGKQSYFPKWEPRSNSYDDIQERIKDKSMRVLKSECLDLPPFIRKEIKVDLSSEQKRVYESMQKDYLAFIKDQEGKPRAVVAQLAVTKALRLQQIVSGFVKDDTGTVHRLECPRLDALRELLEDLCEASKVIVWCSFQENYAMVREICDKLGLMYREIHGEALNIQQQMKDFRELPEVKVMIANQKAGGVGVNLIESNVSIYYSKSFSLEDELQSEARNYRGGSERHTSVTKIDLIAEGTIDELVNEALLNKQKISDKILTWEV